MAKRDNTVQHLSLYHYQSCPFCRMASQAINKLGLDIERRDVQRNPQHRNELIRGGGKPQVPCLRIKGDDGRVQWLYESRDIIDYLTNYTEHAA